MKIDTVYKGQYLATIVYVDKERGDDCKPHIDSRYEFTNVGSLGISTSFEETMSLIWGDAVDLVEVDSLETLEVFFEETVGGELVTNVKWGQSHEFMRCYYVLFHRRPGDITA